MKVGYLRVEFDASEEDSPIFLTEAQYNEESRWGSSRYIRIVYEVLEND